MKLLLWPRQLPLSFTDHNLKKKKKICLYRVADKTLYLSLLLIAVSNFQDKYKETTKTDILTLQMKTLKHPKGEEELQKLRGKSHVLRVGKV